MGPRSPGRAMRAALYSSAVFLLSGCPSPTNPGGNDAGLSQTLFVGHAEVLVSYDIASGEERPGTVTSFKSPTDLQALADGTIVGNLTNSNEFIAVDGRTMLEKARLPSSAKGAVRPVHGFITPLRNGRQYWVSLNDGQGGDAGTNSARFFSLVDGDNYAAKGEVGLGVGHHKASFSSTRERFVASNIADCDTVFGVYDYADVGNIKTERTWNAFELGWDGGSFATRCDPTFQNGVPPSPHGCATSKLSGKAYCNVTSSGDIAVIALDAAPPTLTRIDTNGEGGGYTKTSADGRYVYSVQEEPREGKGGATCQVGQLITIDAQTDMVTAQTPLLYLGPGCSKALTGTDEETANPGHIVISKDGKTLYVTLAGGFGVAAARTRQELVVDLSSPAQPAQKASIAVGAGTGHHGDTLSGDGKYLFVANNSDNTVSQIDTATNTVVRTFDVRPSPQTLATFGDAEGPSHQTGPIE